MKKRIILSSIITMLLCFCMIGGATYALFTSETSVNIAVTSGKVKVEAGIENLELYSMDVKQVEFFENGGTAVYENGVLTLSNVTPGDKVEFDIVVKNTSNVDIQYKVNWVVEGKLSEVLVATANEEDLANVAWTKWSKDAAEKQQTIKVVVELPVEVGNDYQEQTANIKFTVEAVQANANLVGTEAELKEAIAKGGKYFLSSNLVIDNNTTLTVASGKTVELNLNGYAITSTADKSGNQELFLVKGNMTVVNGSLEYTASNNQGWGAMIAIFDVTAGGVLNMENVTAEVSGSDMNFIVHLNNWGTATLNVNNCDFTASYVAIRAFNSGYDMNTVTVENTDFHGGRVFWVHNYTSEGKDDSTLTLDIYGNGNTTDNEKPVRFGFSVSTYYDINGNEIN